MVRARPGLRALRSERDRYTLSDLGTPSRFVDALGEISEQRFRQRLARIKAFEDILERERVIVIKLLLHLSREQQYKCLHADAVDSARSWKVTQNEWGMWSKHAGFSEAALEAIEATEDAGQPWHGVVLVDAHHET